MIVVFLSFLLVEQVCGGPRKRSRPAEHPRIKQDDAQRSRQAQRQGLANAQRQRAAQAQRQAPQKAKRQPSAKVRRQRPGQVRNRHTGQVQRKGARPVPDRRAQPAGKPRQTAGTGRQSKGGQGAADRAAIKRARQKAAKSDQNRSARKTATRLVKGRRAGRESAKTDAERTKHRSGDRNNRRDRVKVVVNTSGRHTTRRTVHYDHFRPSSVSASVCEPRVYRYSNYHRGHGSQHRWYDGISYRGGFFSYYRHVYYRPRVYHFYHDHYDTFGWSWPYDFHTASYDYCHFGPVQFYHHAPIYRYYGGCVSSGGLSFLIHF